MIFDDGPRGSSGFLTEEEIEERAADLRHSLAKMNDPAEAARIDDLITRTSALFGEDFELHSSAGGDEDEPAGDLAADMPDIEIGGDRGRLRQPVHLTIYGDRANPRIFVTEGSADAELVRTLIQEQIKVRKVLQKEVRQLRDQIEAQDKQVRAKPRPRAKVGDLASVAVVASAAIAIAPGRGGDWIASMIPVILVVVAVFIQVVTGAIGRFLATRKALKCDDPLAVLRALRSGAFQDMPMRLPPSNERTGPRR